MKVKRLMGWALLLALFVGAVVFLASAKNSEVSNQTVGGVSLPTTPEGLRALELLYLQSAVDSSLFNFSFLELAGLENVSTSSDEGGPFLALHLFTGQPKKNNGVRSEISIDYPYQEGETVRYSWQFRIPEDFQSDTPANRWWVLADWHDQPDRTKGETWDTYAGIGQSAPIVIGYGYLNNTDMIGFTYGVGERQERGLPISKNKWYKITLEVTWSQDNNGRARVFIDDNKEAWVDMKGPNMLNAFQHYMKAGMYRHPDIALDNTIHIRQVRITKLQ